MTIPGPERLAPPPSPREGRNRVVSESGREDDSAGATALGAAGPLLSELLNCKLLEQYFVDAAVTVREQQGIEPIPDLVA